MINPATIDPATLPALPLDERQALPDMAAAVVLAGATVERLPSVNEARWHEKVQEHGYL